MHGRSGWRTSTQSRFGLDGIHGDEGEKAIRASEHLVSVIPSASIAIHGGIVEVRGGSLQSCSVVDLKRLALSAPAGQILITEDGGRNTNIRV